LPIYEYICGCGTFETYVPFADKDELQWCEKCQDFAVRRAIPSRLIIQVPQSFRMTASDVMPKSEAGRKNWENAVHNPDP